MFQLLTFAAVRDQGRAVNLARRANAILTVNHVFGLTLALAALPVSSL